MWIVVCFDVLISFMAAEGLYSCTIFSWCLKEFEHRNATASLQNYYVVML